MSKRAPWFTPRPCPHRNCAIVCAALVVGSLPAHGADFFWSATDDVFGWFDRETPNGPPGFSPWNLLGGGISGEAPGDVSDTATFGLTTKTTTYNSGITIDRATINGGELQINGGTLTTVNGVVLQGADAELSFTGGTLNTSASSLTVNAGTVRLISGFGTLSADVVSSGDFIFGGGGTMTFNRFNGQSSQNAGVFSVASGTSANVTGSGYSMGFNGGSIENDGAINVSSNSVFTVDGATVNNNGDMLINTAGTFNMDAGILNTTGPIGLTRQNAGTFNYNGGQITGNAVQINGGALNLNIPLGTSSTTVGSPEFLFTDDGTLGGDIHSAMSVTIDATAGSTSVGTTGTWTNAGELTLTGGVSGSGFRDSPCRVAED